VPVLSWLQWSLQSSPLFSGFGFGFSQGTSGKLRERLTGNEFAAAELEDGQLAPFNQLVERRAADSTKVQLHLADGHKAFNAGDVFVGRFRWHGTFLLHKVEQGFSTSRPIGTGLPGWG
jgi:hypothetical protein